MLRTVERDLSWPTQDTIGWSQDQMDEFIWMRHWLNFGVAHPSAQARVTHAQLRLGINRHLEAVRRQYGIDGLAPWDSVAPDAYVGLATDLFVSVDYLVSNAATIDGDGSPTYDFALPLRPTETDTQMQFGVPSPELIQKLTSKE